METISLADNSHEMSFFNEKKKTQKKKKQTKETIYIHIYISKCSLLQL